MIHILKAADRKRDHLGGVHVCTTLVPCHDANFPPSGLAGITDAILLPGEIFVEPTPPPTARTVLTYVLEGVAERSTPLPWAPSHLTPGSSLIEPLTTGNSASLGGGRWHNPSPVEVSHLLRFWITRRSPARETKTPANPPPAPPDAHTPRLRACPSGGPNHGCRPQGMALWHTTLHHGQRWRRSLVAGHHAWINVTSGDVWCSGKLLTAGDAALTHDEPCLRLQAKRPAKVFVLEFDM